MKEIQLTQEKITIVDDEDFDFLSQWKWFYTCHGYAVRQNKIPGKGQRLLFMHRVILNTPNGMESDHINGDKLDNRRCNLRICTKSENMHNTGIRKTNTSGFKGVSFAYGKWKAQIRIDGKKIYLGLFKTPEMASAVHDRISRNIYGVFRQEHGGNQ